MAKSQALFLLIIYDRYISALKDKKTKLLMGGSGAGRRIWDTDRTCKE
jgi:hypothetical protein